MTTKESPGRFAVPSFGDCLREARAAAGLTGAAVEDITGYQKSSIYRMEANARSVHWHTMYRLIVQVGLGLEYFFPEALILETAARILERRRAAEDDDRGPAEPGA